MTQAETAERFQALHERGCFVLPNAWDAGSARILAAQGFAAIATTSAGLAFMLGRRDGEAAVSRDDALRNAADIVAAIDLPVSADLEDGYGAAPADCAETVRLAVAAGLCGCTIEDTTADPAAPIHGVDAAVGRVRTAVAAARAAPYRSCSPRRRGPVGAAPTTRLLQRRCSVVGRCPVRIWGPVVFYRRDKR